MDLYKIELNDSNQGFLESTLLSWSREAEELKAKVNYSFKNQLDNLAVHSQECLEDIQDEWYRSNRTIWVCKDSSDRIRSIMVFQKNVLEEGGGWAEVCYLLSSPQSIYLRSQGTSSMLKGAGTFLMNELIEYLTIENQKMIQLIASNTSQEFYKRFGFYYRSPSSLYMTLELFKDSTLSA